MSAFGVAIPRTLEEAIDILDTLEQEGTRYYIKAGGTDVLVWIKKRAIAPQFLVDISNISELRGVSRFPYRGLRIGAMASISETASDEVKTYYRSIYDACISHSDPLIRNKATVVGNVCSAVPSGDMLPSLLVQKAQVHLAGPKGKRVISLDDYITGPRKTAQKKNELVTHLWIPETDGQNSGCYLKLGRRNALDLAQVGIACVILDSPCATKREYRIACGAVAPKPIRAVEAEKILSGAKKLDAGLMEQACTSAMEATSPISDVRASKDYRRLQVKELTRRCLDICLNRIGG